MCDDHCSCASSEPPGCVVSGSLATSAATLPSGAPGSFCEPRNSFRPFRERDIPSVGPPRTVARLIAVDDDLHADSDRVLVDAAPEQAVRRSGLDHPVLHRAVRFLHLHVHPRVRVDPFHLRDGGGELDRLFRVEFGSERVMRPGRRRRARARFPRPPGRV